MRHLVSIADLTDQQIVELLDRAAAYEAEPLRAKDLLAGCILCTAFYEPSTRTRLSFEAAAIRLGGAVIGFSEGGSTSSAKGETLEDTIRVLSGYADAIVLRHPETGAAKRAAEVADASVINAGDGAGEHPTQTLLDLYTIRKEHGRIAGLKVGVVGDLRYGRTVHSLVPALKRLGAEPVAVAAPGLDLPEEVGAGIETADLETAATHCDVLYVTRIQQERFLDKDTYQAVKGSFLVDPPLLERTGSRAIVLHPLPRVDEVSASLDALSAAKYFDQARNGVPVRMAVLSTLLEEGW